MSASTEQEVDGFEQRLHQRMVTQSHPLSTVPKDTSHLPRGVIPNTPLSVATISFLLGSLFSFGVLLFVTNGYGLYWWATYQLGYFLAAWSAFHWGEFAVTAGWNSDKCSVDCEYVAIRVLCLLTMPCQRSSWRMARCTTLRIVWLSQSTLQRYISNLSTNNIPMFPSSVSSHFMSSCILNL